MKNILLLVIAFSLASCLGNDNHVKDNGQIYVADLDNANHEEAFNYSSIFKNAKIIIPEFTDNSIIGYIDKIHVFDNYILILDRNMFNMSQVLFVFDTQGNFIRRIGNIGKGPGEYTAISDFTVDDSGFVYILDTHKHNILKYDVNTGNYINTVNIAGEGSVRSHHISLKNNLLFADAYFNQVTKDNYLLRVIDPSSGNQQESLLLESDYNIGYNHTSLIESYAFYDVPNGAVFLRQYMDTIFHIGSGGVTPYFAIKSKNLMAQNDINDLVFDPRGDATAYFNKIRDKNKIYNMREFIEHDDIIFLAYNEGRDTKRFSYNKKNRVTTIYQGLKQDMLSSEKLIGYTYPQFGYSDSKGVYYYMRPEYIPKFQQYAKDGILNPDIENLDRLKTLSEDANPFILFFEFK